MTRPYHHADDITIGKRVHWWRGPKVMTGYVTKLFDDQFRPARVRTNGFSYKPHLDDYCNEIGGKDDRPRRVRPQKENIPNHNEKPSGKRPRGFVASDVIGAHHHENQSTLRRPWQRTVAHYRVEGDGIYLRTFNVRLATFAPNSKLLRDALARMFDAAHALVESERAALVAPGDYALTKLPKVRKSKTVTVKGRKYFRAAKEFRE